MALTAIEEKRLQSIEETLNRVQTALNNLATKTQLKQLLNIRQAEIDALRKELEELSQRVSNLESA